MSKLQFIYDTISLLIEMGHTDDEIVEKIGCPFQIVQEMRDLRG